MSGKPSGSSCNDTSHAMLARIRAVPRPRAPRVASTEMPENTRASNSMTVESNPADNAEDALEYVPDIFANLRASEVIHTPDADFLTGQTQITPRMRAILVDWLVDVHRNYKLRPSTLFICISVMDRFLEKEDTSRKNLQLVGVTCMIIAAKYEEVYPPKITDFVYATDNAYSRDDVINMELLILAVLDFQICTPMSLEFLERYQQVLGCSEAHSSLSQYVLELTLPASKMVQYAPSHLAAAAILLSNNVLQKQPAWPHAAVSETGMTEATIRQCAKEMCYLLEDAETSTLQAVRKKFSLIRHHSVGKFTFTAGARNPVEVTKFTREMYRNLHRV